MIVSASGGAGPAPACVIGERLAGEAAVKRLQVQAGDVDEPEPLVLGGPPQGTLRAGVEDDVDPVVTDRVPVDVRDGFLLALAVQAGGDLVVECEGIPGEPPARPERGCDPLEGAAAGPRRQVQQRPERAVDQCRRLIQGQVPHIVLAQVKSDACPGRPDHWGGSAACSFGNFVGCGQCPPGRPHEFLPGFGSRVGRR